MPEGNLGDYLGISVNGACRIGQHAANALNPGDNIHYLAAHIAESKEAVALIDVGNVDQLAAELAPTCPLLAAHQPPLTSRQWTQCFLVGAELFHTFLFRTCRTDVELNKVLPTYLGPIPKTIGLNTDNCLTTGVRGLASQTRGTPGSTRDPVKYTESLLTALADGGLGLTVTCFVPKAQNQNGDLVLPVQLRIASGVRVFAKSTVAAPASASDKEKKAAALIISISKAGLAVSITAYEDRTSTGRITAIQVHIPAILHGRRALMREQGRHSASMDSSQSPLSLEFSRSFPTTHPVLLESEVTSMT